MVQNKDYVDNFVIALPSNPVLLLFEVDIDVGHDMNSDVEFAVGPPVAEVQLCKYTLYG